MLLRKVEFWGLPVETTYVWRDYVHSHLGSLHACIYVGSGTVGFSLVIDDMVCYVGIAMRNRLRAFAPRMNIMYP
jgi:hypothetical protein